MSSSMVPATFSGDDESCTYAVQLAFMSILPTALNAAIELEVFETIAKAGPGAYLSAAQISTRLPRRHVDTAARLDRMLALLASYNVLTCSVDEADADGKAVRKYGAAPVAKFFTKNEDGASLAPMALMGNSKFFAEADYYLKDCIMDGEIPFNKAFGMSMFEFLAKEPAGSNKAFDEAMMSYSVVIVKGILEAYKGFDDVNSVADVGGGLGATLDKIIKKHPHIKGINFDLPHVISKAPAIPGVEHIVGDMFESVPAGADVILLKEVLHNWGDDQCVKLLKNCWEALGDDCSGKVVVIDRCLPERPENASEAQCAFQSDLIMMVVHPGKERTKEEFESMAKKAGFSGIHAICSFATHWVLEFYK